MQGAALVDGCEEPAPPGRGEARGSRARGRLPRARRPSCRRGPAAREPSCAARTLRRRRGAGGRRRGAPRPAPGGAQMRLRAARYVVRIRTVKILYYHCGDLSWTDSIVAFDRLVCPCRRQPTRKCGSHKRKPRQPCARRDGADAPPCTPPIAFPAGAAAAPRVRVCCAS
jgi:hypothetical protein